MRESKIDIIENSSVHCRLINDEVFHAYFKPESNNSTEEIRIIIDEYSKVSASRPLKFLFEMAPFASIDLDGCKSLKNSKLVTLSEAFVTNDLAQLLLINFYFRTKSKTHPSKMFREKTEAVNWLKSCS